MILESLTFTDLQILKKMFKEPIGNTAYILSKRLDVGTSYCHHRLRLLKDRGIIRRSHTGIYHINPVLKQEVVETLIQHDMLQKVELDGMKHAQEEKVKMAEREADAVLAIQAQAKPETRRGTPSSSEIVKEVKEQEEE